MTHEHHRNVTVTFYGGPFDGGEQVMMEPVPPRLVQSIGKVNHYYVTTEIGNEWRAIYEEAEMATRKKRRRKKGP